MSNLAVRIPVVSAALLLLSCGATTTTESLAPPGVDAALDSVSGAQGRGNDEGTELTATVGLTSVVCSGVTGTATLDGQVQTTGSVDSVEITAQVDGGARVLLDTLLPQDFAHDGRIKTAAYSVALSLENGTHSVVLCFTQSGSQGREPKEVCGAPVEVVVACTVEETCGDARPFGDIVGNNNLCRGNGPPHVPVHVKGDFGDAPALTITGPNGFSHATTMNHAGESCVYHYNWDTAGNGGAGRYLFKVVGNGVELTFDAELKCR